MTVKVCSNGHMWVKGDMVTKSGKYFVLDSTAIPYILELKKKKQLLLGHKTKVLSYNDCGEWTPFHANVNSDEWYLGPFEFDI